jgi:hypothetical protein
MNCIIYMVNYNFATHTTYLLTLMASKYNKLQVSSTTQKLNSKALLEIFGFAIAFCN